MAGSRAVRITALSAAKKARPFPQDAQPRGEWPDATRYIGKDGLSAYKADRALDDKRHAHPYTLAGIVPMPRFAPQAT
jgi:hypothetical protein